MAEINIVVVESPKKARRFTENYRNYTESHPELKNKFFFISTGGSINTVDFPKIDKLRDVNFSGKDINIKIVPSKREKIDQQLKRVLKETFNVRDWRSEKTNFIIASDPDREGAGIAKGVTSYLNELEAIDDVKIVKTPFKYMDIESYSFRDLHNRLESGDFKKNYDVDLANQQIMRSAIDKFLGFSSAGWTSNKVNVSTGRIKRPLLYLIDEGRRKEQKNKETDVIDIVYTTSVVPEQELNRSFVLKDPIKKEIIETQPLKIKYEDLKPNHSYIPNLAELLLIASSRANIPMKDVYSCVEKLYLGVRLKYEDESGKENDVIQSLISYPRTDSKIIEEPIKKVKQQDELIKNHLKSSTKKLLNQEYDGITPRKFKNVNDNKKYPYIQKGHEALLPNFISVSSLFLGNALYTDKSEEMDDENRNISLTYMALRDQVFCTLYKTKRNKELKLYYVNEEGQEVNLPLLVPETIADKDILPIDSVVSKSPSHLTSELSLFKQMLKHNLARPSTYHQITNNLNSFKRAKYDCEPLVVSEDYQENKVTSHGKRLLEESNHNPYFNIKYTKTMESELSDLKGIKTDRELKDEIASQLSEINNTVNKTLPKEVKEGKSYSSYKETPSRDFGR